MEVFSLEEEDGGGLFLTQESRNEVSQVNDGEGVGDSRIEGSLYGINAENFTLLTGPSKDNEASTNTEYSDISDPEDDFMNPVYGRADR